MSTIDYQEIGRLLKEFRINNRYAAHRMATLLGVSRSAIYRLEKGEIVKIDILNKVAKLLDIQLTESQPILAENFTNAGLFFDKMRELEQKATHIFSHFDPFSYLLSSDNYDFYLQKMLLESGHESQYFESLEILKERKKNKRKPIVYNLISEHHIKRFMHMGLVGDLGLSLEEKKERVDAAINEVKVFAEHIGLTESVKISLSENLLPNLTFQIFFYGKEPIALIISSFRLGDLPNLKNGFATIHRDKQIINDYIRLFEEEWDKGDKDAIARERLLAICEEYLAK